MSRESRDLITVIGPDHKWAVDGTEDNPEYGWRDMTADLSNGRLTGPNAPTFTAWNGGNMDALSFDAATMNETWITFHPNHDVIEGELYFPHIHWMPNTTSTGVVRWGIEYTQAKGHNQAAFNPTTTIIYLEDNVSAADQYGHRIIEATTGIAMPEVDSLIIMRVFRDAAHVNDTFPDAVFGLTVDIHYRAGRMFTKGKRPDFDEADS